MNLQLQGKKALVTGSTAGIGYAIALQLAYEGASVIVNGRTTERVDDAVSKIETQTDNHNVTGVAVDFADVKQIDRLLIEVDEVDILINNVGIFEPKVFKDITDADWLNFLR